MTSLGWAQQLEKQKTSLVITLGVWLAWLALYNLDLSVLGSQISVLIYIPVLVTAFFFGLTAGVIAAFIGTGLNVLMLETYLDMPSGGLHRQAYLFYALSSLVLGGLVGYASSLRQALSKQQKELLSRDNMLEHHAYRDPLTGLFNRKRFEEAFETQRETITGDGALALFLIDLDDFKQLNDSFGQATGDELIRQVGLRLNKYITQSGVLARLAGDEFILLTPVERLGQAGGFALRLLDQFREPFNLLEQTFFVRASIGISFFPRDGDTLDELLRAADSAMYRVKRRGKGSYESYNPTSHSNLNERFDLEYKLRDAVERDELELYYQPQVDVQSGQLWGLEALLRWHHPEFGLLGPDRFIDIAEHTGLIVPIGTWVLETACTQQRRWQEAGYAPSRIAVNVSTVQFSHPDFLTTVMQALESTGLDPNALELEITEGALMQNMGSAKETLNKLRVLGVNLSIDDFGVGYSSLSYLQELPVDTLKIDRSFLPQITGSKTPNQKDTALIRAIIGLAQGLDKTVITEGVDNEIHIEFLRQVGCEYAQGYYFGKPIPSHDIEQVLETFNWNIQKTHTSKPAPTPHPIILGDLEVH